MLEFLADMNISPQTVSVLNKNGRHTIRVSEILSANSSDLEILNYARERNMVVITHDLDFSELLAIHGFGNPSVINLRLDDAAPGVVTQRISDVISQLEAELEKGVVVSVDENTARYRYLPIK